MIAHMVQSSSFYIQRKFILFRETISYSEKMLLISEKHFHIQSDFFIVKEIKYIQRIADLKKLFYVHRKFLYL